MPIDYRDYPANWRSVSKDIRHNRAKLRCERCNVRQYGVGQWSEKFKDGDVYDVFTYAGGNLYYDDFQYTSSYQEARDAAEYLNEWGRGDDEPPFIVIVLTVAHQCECKPLCADPSHLLALCQKCHNQQDGKMRAANARRTRARKAGQMWLGDLEAR